MLACSPARTGASAKRYAKRTDGASRAGGNSKASQKLPCKIDKLSDRASGPPARHATNADPTLLSSCSIPECRHCYGGARLIADICRSALRSGAVPSLGGLAGSLVTSQSP
jgi:hypothetical protein